MNAAVRSAALLLVIAYLGFISLGLPDAVAGVAWPHLRGDFRLSQSAFGGLFLAGGLGYFFSSFFAGRLTQQLGVGPLLTLSSLLVGVAMIGDSLAPQWIVLLAFSIVWGLGSGAIDAALNHFVAGAFSAKHVSWLHACYSIGAATGPLLMTACLTRANSWRLGYAIVGTIMLAMSALFFATRRKWAGEESTQPEAASGATQTEVLREPLVWAQIITFLLYTGLENTVGQWSFTLLTEGRGLGERTAGVFVFLYYGSIALGRVAFGPIAERVGLDRLVRLSTLAAVIGAAGFAFAPHPVVAAGGLVVLGLGLASVFPTLMTRTPQRLGARLAAHAIGFQVSAAMLGAAILPSLTGFAAERWGLEAIGGCDVAIAVALFLIHEGLVRRPPRPTSAVVAQS